LGKKYGTHTYNTAQLHQAEHNYQKATNEIHIQQKAATKKLY
jgi:isopentenyldiphosphate isomerase